MSQKLKKKEKKINSQRHQVAQAFFSWGFDAFFGHLWWAFLLRRERFLHSAHQLLPKATQAFFSCAQQHRLFSLLVSPMLEKEFYIETTAALDLAHLRSVILCLLFLPVFWGSVLPFWPSRALKFGGIIVFHLLKSFIRVDDVLL